MAKKLTTRIRKSIVRHLNSIIPAFYSPQLYIEVMRSWRGFGVGYLFLLIAVVSIPLAARTIVDFNNFFDDKLIDPIEKMPLLYLQNGKLTIDKEMPYVIKNKSNEVSVIIDTTGSVSEMTDKYPDLMILITDNTLYFRPPKTNLFFMDNSERKISAQSFNPNSNEVFSGKEWIKDKQLARIKLLVEVIIFPTLTLFAFVIYTILTLLMAFLGQIIARAIFKLQLSYRESSRIIRVSCTPQIFILFLASTFHRSVAGVISMALIACYFSYAVIVIQRDRKKLVLVN